MGKLRDKKNAKYFNQFIYPVIYPALKKLCKNNKEVLTELEIMKNSLNNNTKYYNSYNIIEEILMLEEET